MQILTNDFKVLLVDQFYYSLCLCSNTTYHLVGGKPEAFTSNTIPTPSQSVFESSHNVYDEMMFGKVVRKEDVAYMIRNIPWTSGEAYDVYDDLDDDLSTKDFYVVADQTDGSYGVFKCLYKKPTGNPTVVNKPNINQTSPTDQIYITGDGYHWKYMFTIDASTYNKFATSAYVPIVEDTDVTNNAVDGAIDAIQIERVGANYNNYASGTIREAAVGGNTLRFNLDADSVKQIYTYDILYTGNGTFSEGDTIDIDVPGANTVSAEIYRTGPGTISIVPNGNTESITQATVSSSNTITLTANSVTADVVQIRPENIPNLSIDDDFYKNASIYIRSGAGAGQIRTITSYTVSDNDRFINIDEAFSVLPNSSSTYSILPRIIIQGDGTGAEAIPVIDTTANSISDVQIINRGSGYTYANTTITGNTGVVDANGAVIQANSAVLRSTITPEGGHGSDVISELYATNIGISIDFANSEVRDDVSYSKIALVRNILHNNVQLTLDSLQAGDYAVGEIINQEDPSTSSGIRKARGEVASIDTANNVLTLTNVFGDFESSTNNEIFGLSSNTHASVSDINRDISTFNNQITLTITTTSGTFEVGDTVTQAQENNTAEGYVISANSTSLDIVNVFGEFSASGNTISGSESSATGVISDVSERNIIDNSGSVVYIENTDEITRSSTSTERIKIIVKF